MPDEVSAETTTRGSAATPRWSAGAKQRHRQPDPDEQTDHGLNRDVDRQANNGKAASVSCSGYLTSRHLQSQKTIGRLAMNPAPKCAAVAALIVTSLILPAGSATADVFGTCSTDSTGCYADGVSHTWCAGPSLNDNPAVVNNIEESSQNMDAQTIINTIKFQDCAGVDVLWVQENLPPGTAGQWQCRVRSGNICYEAKNSIDADYIANLSEPAANRRKTTCHELGHSVGLQHHDPPYEHCMINGPINSGHTQYSGHHVDHIDGHY